MMNRYSHVFGNPILLNYQYVVGKERKEARNMGVVERTFIRPAFW